MPVAQKNVEVRHQLLERLSEARVRTDEIFDIVKPDSIYERPIPERHRINFYLGHLEAFDWNLLRERVLGMKAFHPDLRSIICLWNRSHKWRASVRSTWRLAFHRRYSEVRPANSGGHRRRSGDT